MPIELWLARIMGGPFSFMALVLWRLEGYDGQLVHQ